MLVRNAHRTMAIVVRHDGRKVNLVPMKSGRLLVRRLTGEQFRQEWLPYEYPLEKALAVFIQHAQEQGATTEALTGLQRLVERQSLALQELF